MKYLKYYEAMINKTISDYPYVIDWFSRYYPDKKISNIPVYIISEEDWVDGKPRQSENDRKGGIKIHEDQVSNDIDYGWLVHEVGHVLQLTQGDERPSLVSQDEVDGYPNAEDETSSWWYQFHYLISQGFSKEDVFKMVKSCYDDCKGGGSTWRENKDIFFPLYYQRIKEELKKPQ